MIKAFYIRNYDGSIYNLDITDKSDLIVKYFKEHQEFRKKTSEYQEYVHNTLNLRIRDNKKKFLHLDNSFKIIDNKLIVISEIKHQISESEFPLIKNYNSSQKITKIIYFTSFIKIKIVNKDNVQIIEFKYHPTFDINNIITLIDTIIYS